MARSLTKPKPTFFWQGMLVVLPVALLAAIGLVSLRQDQALARHDATERAQALAEVLAQKMWNSLLALKAPAELDRHAFQVDAAGRLVFPRPIAAVPSARPLDFAALTPEQSRLWLAARSAEAGEQPAAAVRQAYADFLDSKPLPDFAAYARYAEGLALVKESKPDLAADAFQTVVRDYSDAVGETGLPLRPLAQLKLFELALEATTKNAPEQATRLDAVCSDAVNHPSQISGTIMNRALELAAGTELVTKARAWHELWGQQQLCRDLFAAASQYSLDQSMFWFTLPPDSAANMWTGLTEPSRATFLGTKASTFQGTGTRLPVSYDKWKAVVSAAPHWFFFADDVLLAFGVRDTASNHWFVCRTESELGYQLSTVAASTRGIPDYFGIGIELAGKKLTSFASDLRVWGMVHYIGGKGLGQDVKEISSALATDVLASATPLGSVADPLKVKVYLTSPSTLYHRQHTRTFWFGSLIAAAAAVAFVGWFRAWRAFLRQQELAALKTNFVSSVSHELRAPLASVRLMAESLERGKVSEAPKQHEYFGFIVQECRRLSSLIENVLDFSRIEQGRKEYEFEPIDLVALTEQTVKLMEPYAAEKQINLHLQLPEIHAASTDLQPLADGKALQQALVNLIDNAIKHSPKGETVTIGLEAQSDTSKVESPRTSERGLPSSDSRITRSSVDSSAVASAKAGASAKADHASPASHHARRSTLHAPLSTPPSPRLLLWVEDHGEGIPTSEHEKIFERFYRRGSELRRETQGVGIGLSIVKHIVEAHGGCVLVRSDVGQGSRFTIELPFDPENGRIE